MKTIGNILVILSFIGFGFFVLPLLRAYTTPQPPVPVTPSSGFSIYIPKIHAASPVIATVDPWNKAEYQEALRHGVAHAKGTGLPGGRNTIYLFAHSTGAPWEQLYYNTIFLRLGELDAGDTITLDYHQHRYTYAVIAKKEVLPTDIQYLENTQKNQLILQTCTPIGTSLRRLLIFAVPKQV